jgi:hypothetical protein
MSTDGLAIQRLPSHHGWVLAVGVPRGDAKLEHGKLRLDRPIFVFQTSDPLARFVQQLASRPSNAIFALQLRPAL